MLPSNTRPVEFSPRFSLVYKLGILGVAMWAICLPANAQQTKAEMILTTNDGAVCRPADVGNSNNSVGCCGAPGRRGCSQLPTCTDPNGNTIRHDTYDDLWPCSLPAPSCSPVFAQNLQAQGDRSQPLNVTFYLTSDIHPWRTSFRLPDIVRHVRLMNEYPGFGQWPSLGINGFPTGLMPAPWGLVIAGDLTEEGQEEELGAYRLLYEQGWIVDSIKYPVFPGLGNHDMTGIPVQDEQRMFDYIASTMGCAVNIDPASHSYSWDWNQLHIVELNEWAGYNDTFPGTSIPCTSSDQGVCGPIRSGLPWLLTDLNGAVSDSGRPVIIIQHLGCDAFSMGVSNNSDDHKYDRTKCTDPDTGTNQIWWSQNDRTQLFNAIQGYNVIGYFSGHRHIFGTYSAKNWLDKNQNTMRSLDNFVNASGGEDLNDDATSRGEGGFFVVHVTDSYLDVVPVIWQDPASETSDSLKDNQTGEQSLVAPSGTDPVMAFGLPGCRKRIGDRFIPVPPSMVHLASAGGTMVSITSTTPLPGPLALRVAQEGQTPPAMDFVQTCVNFGDASEDAGYVLLNLSLGQSLMPGNPVTVNAGYPFNPVTMSLVVLTPVRGSSVATISPMITPSQVIAGDQLTGSVTFYGLPNSMASTFVNGDGGLGWLTITPVSTIDNFGYAVVNYTINLAKLPGVSNGNFSATINFSQLEADGDGVMFSRGIPVTLHIKTAVNVTLTSTPPAFATTNTKVTFTATLNYTPYNPGDGNVRPSGEIDLIDEQPNGAQVLLSRGFLGPLAQPEGSNCNTYPNDTVVFGDYNSAQYCPSLQATGTAAWQLDTDGGSIHHLVASYIGSGQGDSYYAPGQSSPYYFRVGSAVSSVRVIGGAGQVTVPGASFDNPLRIEALDSNSNPVAGAPVQAFFASGPSSAVFPDTLFWNGYTDLTGVAVSEVPIAIGLPGTITGLAEVTEGPDPSTVFPLTSVAPGASPQLVPSITNKINNGTTPGDRQWTLSVRNTGGPAYGIQVTKIAFTQEAGAACTPVIESTLPVAVLPSLPSTGSGTATVNIGFGSCAATARFTVTFTVAANAGAYSAQGVVAHQFQ